MKNRGFSLIELMIVVAIIMIMGAGGMWGFKKRMYKNEILKMKTEIPTLIGNSTLRVYEKAISGAAITISSDRISISSVGSGAEYKAKSNYFEFVTSPTSIDGGITKDGAFNSDFDIIVIDKTKTPTEAALTFSIQTKTSLGVYSLTTSQSSF